LARICIFNGTLRGRSFDLKDASTLIGRGPDNDIRINDSSVSRRHAKIVRENDKYFIEDLNSRNGTSVNGIVLRNGDRLEVQEDVPIVLGNLMINLDKTPSDDEMIFQYSIDLADKTGELRESLLYKDRRITKREDLETIHEISTTLMQSLDINEICEKIMETLFSYFKRIDSGAILLMDHKTGQLKKTIARSRSKEKGIKFNYSRTIVNRVIRDCKAIIMADTSQEDVMDLSESIKMMQIKSVMCVPLISKSQIQGVVYVHAVNVPQGFRKEDLFLLTGLSSPAALAIENALLYKQRKQAEEALRRAHEDLYDFSQALERKVQERTEELNEKNKILVETEKLAALGKMANKVAHELRNPLTVVGGLARRLFEKTPEDDPNKEYLDIILGEVAVLEKKISEIIKLDDVE